jgi:hypothetical protein
MGTHYVTENGLREFRGGCGCLVKPDLYRIVAGRGFGFDPQSLSLRKEQKPSDCTRTFDGDDHERFD